FQYVRLTRIHAELEEKLEASEIQNKQQSAEYRTMMQQKDVEISHLKARQSGLQEEVQKLQHSAQSATSDPAVLPVTTASTTTTSSSYMSRPLGAPHHQGFHGSDEMDFGDVIWSQQEINRLSTEVMRLEAEVSHWRRVSQVGWAGNGDQGEVLKLQRIIKELREEMGREVDEHQHELAALQDAQRQKMADVIRRHRDELAEYEERIEELEEQKQTGGEEEEQTGDLQNTIQSLQEAAEERLKEEQDKQLKELTANLEEAGKRQATLQQEKEEAQAENAELLQNYTRLQTSVTELQSRVQEQEGKARNKAQLDQEIQGLRNVYVIRLWFVTHICVMPYKQVTKVYISQTCSKVTRLRQGYGHAVSLCCVSTLQHVISVKEQLSVQLKESEAVVARLQSDLSTTADQKVALQQELKAQQEKLSHSAFTLNDLHMGKQQLEDTVKELRDKLGRATEMGKEARRETQEFQRTIQEREEELSAARAELCEAGERGRESGGSIEQLEVLRRELAEMRSSQEKMMSEDYEMKMEKQRLKTEAEQAQGRIEELARQVREVQAALTRTVLEKDTRIKALKLEKSQLEGELGQAEKGLQEQTRQYQQTIEELTAARSMDASALQTEHERTVRLNQEKDLEISQLKRDVEQMSSDHRDTNEMLSITVAGQKQLTDLLQEKDSFTESLRANMAATQRELEAGVQAATQDAETLRGALEEKDKQLGGMKEDNSHLKVRLQYSHSDLQKMLTTELENEISQLKSTRDGLEEEGHSLKRRVEEQRGHLLSSQQSLLAQQNELEQAHQRHEQSRENYDRLIHAKDEEIGRLQQEVDHLGHTHSSQEQEVVILQQEDKTQSSLNNGENDNEKHDLSKVEINRLVKGIKEKETEISQLNEKNLNLTRQLAQLVVSREEIGKLSQMLLQKDLEIQALHARVSLGGHSQDVMFLQQQLQAYAVEREQVLAVLNEKTRENSQLRGDYQRIMDIVAGKEAVLLKVQQENQRLSTMSDPSGSQEMFRETIQNLSRIIREKDIEIDALTQKCQTLVSVLQAGDSGGVSSNQFEELLQDRDTLKQQVKKMEEWKMQVITTVKNMQHESGQLVEELHKLQGQVDADNDCTSTLSVDYSRLIHSYEQKERKLGSLSHELAHVQQTISQLSSTKDVLLGKLDSVAQSPQVTPLSAALTSTAQPPAAVEPPRHQVAAPATPGNQEGLRQELESLRALLSERETMIRTLQENNHRLCNSAQVSDSEQRGQAEEARQVRERLDVLQRSVREKDLLIKTKGDQLTQVSESLRNRESDNEVLKQAVTNLKERALILEMDTRKLKDENEAVAQRSREKESEFRALQETNMQVSLLMREKEFERSAMSEKAAAMEKMLKDREQKSGELNQLLNELRSMQEKAVAFQQERDQVMLALKQKQMETTAVQTELQHVKDREQRLKLELDRLRNHLLEIEESYTREVLAAEDREAELCKRVTLLDDRLATSSSQVESTSHQASLQVESLQEQLSGTVRQRDEALTQLRAARDQVNQYAMSLSNLQMVLEQFQQEEKAMYSSELDKYKREKDEWRRKALKLEDMASALQINLDEANAALDSASRLTDQLDLKEEQLEELKKQVDVRQEMLEESQDKLMNLLNSTEGQVDQALMRNLFMGYFHTPKPKRSEVLRLMGSVLGLDKDEVNQLLEEEGGHGVGGWVSGWLGGRAVQSVPNTPQRPGAGQGGFNNSFSEMFVKFLEVESRPALPAPRLPVYDIKPLSAPPPGRTTSSAWAQQPEGNTEGRRTHVSNPFLAPRSAAVPLMHHGSGSSSASGGHHHLLMKPISDNLPTFTPVPVSAESGGQVLKDLLKQ
uniref:GRIP domain-containing protein n=1 Tax=Oncorhynchus tshawytscha TaxID=74940 RepID=A0AAZ3S3K0_ONCTS